MPVNSSHVNVEGAKSGCAAEMQECDSNETLI